MTEERTSLIEVEDELVNDIDERMVVESLDVGRYGVFMAARFVQSGNDAWGFLPYELVPPERPAFAWHGWACYTFIILPNGTRIGLVDFMRADPRCADPEAHNAEWQRTIEAREAEGGVMQSRPTEIRLN